MANRKKSEVLPEIRRLETDLTLEHDYAGEEPAGVEDEADEDGIHRPVVVETCPAGHNMGQVFPVQELNGQPHADYVDDERVEAQHERGTNESPEIVTPSQEKFSVWIGAGTGRPPTRV